MIPQLRLNKLYYLKIQWLIWLMLTLNYFKN